MAFTANTFQFNRGVTTCGVNGSGVGTVIHGYKSTTDDYATITTPGYFPDNIDGATDKIFVGDILLIVASDTVGLALITALAPFLVGSNLLGTAGSPITMSVPVAATDANGIKISGTTVQLEVADATHPGIVTALDQVYAGIKMFMSGVQFMTFGGTPATLNYYEEYTHDTTFTLNTETTASIAIKIVRTGSMVILKIPGINTVPGQGAPTANFAANTVLPARFRPTTVITTAAFVTNGGVTSLGAAVIYADGNIDIFNNYNGTTPFTAAQINGFGQFAVPYIII